MNEKLIAQTGIRGGLSADSEMVTGRGKYSNVSRQKKNLILQNVCETHQLRFVSSQARL